MPKSLYLCYFGLREPLVQTQVLPYLREIRDGGTVVDLLTFEPEPTKNWTKDQIKTEKASLAAEGIAWHHLTYHKRPSVPATFYDILNGARVVRSLLQSENFDILHCRVHIPALMAMIARKLSRKKPKILFDIRGFFPEEYTDAGVWPEGGWLYRAAKRVEKWLIRESDGFVVLTEKAREILFPESVESGFNRLGRPVEVIPCCVDLNNFENVDDADRLEIRQKLGIRDRYVIAYVGSFGGWYMTDEMLDLFSAARENDPKSFAMILTQRGKEGVAEQLRNRGFIESDFLVDSVNPAEIPKYLSAADVAISFIKACYSKQSSSPTKIAEYLACGLPIITNRGVGDLDTLIENHRVGALIEDFNPLSYLTALAYVTTLENVRDRCRETAVSEFDLHGVGGPRYRLLYNEILIKEDERQGR